MMKRSKLRYQLRLDNTTVYLRFLNAEGFTRGCDGLVYYEDLDLTLASVRCPELRISRIYLPGTAKHKDHEEAKKVFPNAEEAQTYYKRVKAALERFTGRTQWTVAFRYRTKGEL